MTDPHRSSRTLRAGLIVLVLAIVGCAAPASRSGEGTVAGSAEPRARKLLVIGILQEPPGWTPWTTIGTVGGAQQIVPMARRSLTNLDADGLVQPELAVSVPSTDAGDWRVNADGTMDQTWRIDPAARWHDSTPVTADDFVLGWEILLRPDLPPAVSPGTSLVDNARAIDERTLELHFKGSSIVARQALFDPQPRHILGPLLESGDPERLVSSDYWTTGYVGAGPYRVANWQLGSSLEFAAFDGYVHGRPKIDTIVVKFLTDPNNLLANILSGDVDVAVPDGLSIEQAVELRQGWAAPGTGNNALIFTDGSVVFVAFQHRPEYAKPAAARDPRVREAFYSSMDKDGLNEIANAGLGRLADSWIGPDDPQRSRFADAIPAWTHDVGLAQRRLEEAGWRRGGDGIYASASGERMATEIRVPPGAAYSRVLSLLGDGWRAVGAEVKETQITAVQQGDREYIATHPFADALGRPYRLLDWQENFYSCATLARPETKWAGRRDGYCNPAADQLVKRLMVTVDDNELVDLQVQLMRIVMKEDYAFTPMYWRVSPVVFAKGVTGPGELRFGLYGRGLNTWNVHAWDKAG